MFVNDYRVGEVICKLKNSASLDFPVLREATKLVLIPNHRSIRYFENRQVFHQSRFIRKLFKPFFYLHLD